jgi:hypothetical protein
MRVGQHRNDRLRPPLASSTSVVIVNGRWPGAGKRLSLVGLLPGKAIYLAMLGLTAPLPIIPHACGYNFSLGLTHRFPSAAIDERSVMNFDIEAYQGVDDFIQSRTLAPEPCEQVIQIHRAFHSDRQFGLWRSSVQPISRQL